MIQDPYLLFLQNEAEKIGYIFILDAGEGNGYIETVTGWYIEDLTGWLVPKNREMQLKRVIVSGEQYVQCKDFYVFVRWYRDKDGLRVLFQKS